MHTQHGRRLAAWIWLLSLAPAAASAQIFVYPRHADKSQVRYYEFNWQHVDILVGPQASKKLADPRELPTPPKHQEAIDKGSSLGGPAQPFTQAPAEGSPRTEHLPPAGSVVAAPDGGTPLDGGLAIGTGTAAAIDAGVLVPAGDAGMLALADAGVVNPWYVWPPGLDAGTAVAEGSVGPRSGGVRLFFYERERVVAERAAAIIVDSYRELVTRFQFVPTQTFPYVLYSSYQEFLETTLFPMQEGILGITSTQGDLKLTLPYFGDHSLFADVSLHEMSHQFTIQKVRFLTEQAKVTGDPLESLPLWFVEGLAEFYAKHGIDPEADLLIRDLVVNPDAEMGYALIDFWEDRPFSVLWTYQAGQIRCTFLEDTYGAGFIQRILNESIALVGSGSFRRAAVDFKGLVEKLTGDNPQTVSKKFESWLKRRAFHAYLNSEQDVSSLDLFPDAFALATSLASSPDGQVVLYRSFDEDTGRSRLVLVDPHDPGKARIVVTDGVPGAESLHAVFGRNFDVGKDSLAYVAEVQGRDVIYRQAYSHEATKREPNPAFAQPGTAMRPPGLGPTPPRPPSEPGEGGGQQKEFWDVDLDVGGRVEYRLSEKGLVGAFSPAISPDGKQIAFIGLDEQGVRDLYLLEPTDDKGGFDLTRLTDDPYSERQASWGPSGIVYTSEATATGHFNLFRIVPGKPAERLTNEARDEQDPAALPDGRILFVAYDQGRADVHEVVGNQDVQRTQLSTGVFDLSPGPDGGLWVLFHYRGRRQPAQLKRTQLLSVASTTQVPAAPPYEVATASLLKAQKYRLFALENWEVDPPFGFIGAGQGQVVGQIFAQAADRLRNHGVILYANIFGRLELTNGVLLYQNQAHRVSWGGGLFQSLAFRYDTTFKEPTLRNSFFTGERFWGGVANARYPFDPFVYVEGEIAAGGVNYFLDDLTRLVLATPEYNGAGRDVLLEWEQLNGGTRLQTELTGRVGYDTLRWNPETGPIGGNSVLLELSGAVQPLQRETFGSARLDAEQYFPIFGRTHVFIRGGLGAAFGGRLAPQFFLSSFDTIRGVPFGDQRWLLGRDFLFSTAELQIPLNAILRLIILSDVEAIAGVDFGGVGNGSSAQEVFTEVWQKRVLDVVLGVNFSLGPLIFRLHFARPINTGVPLPVPEGQWVTNFSLGVVGLPGFTDRTRGSSSRRFPFTSPLMFR